MTPPPVRVQRNSYKGSSLRAWISLTLVATDNSKQQIKCLADTGCPFYLIVRPAVLRRFVLVDRASASSNFGLLMGGWVHVVIPEVRYDALLAVYAGDAVIDSSQQSSSDFEGLVGLPLLRQFVYGGDSREFWIQEP